ncbi:MAG: ABC transporter substrate-binding protein [Burkholderiales bacterium]|nr:ABC transporter substrate-binding protein [Burkholderiales bacterium]
MKRIGVLVPFAESDGESRTLVAAFREKLQQLGWTDGHNLRIDTRWASGGVGQIRTFAKELVELKPEVIIVRSTPVTAALLKETRTIPIVFTAVSNPVSDGLVASLARPGGNVTGFTQVESSLGSKWLELLKEVSPRVTRVAVMFNPKTAGGGGSYYLRFVEDAAASIAMKMTAARIQDAGEIERAIDAFTREPNGGLIVLPDFTTVAHRELIVSLAARHRLPAVYPFRAFGTNGGLVTYGIDLIDMFRRAAEYVDRILRGARPSELPVQGPVKFELVINLKTAKAIGLTIPQSILVRADDVIQ